jgi:hypothetical protein
MASGVDIGRWSIRWMAEWEGGGFLGKGDSVCLLEAAEQGLTLVSYDPRTIPASLKIWAELRAATRGSNLCRREDNFSGGHRRPRSGIIPAV